MRNVSQPIGLHDLLWWYASALQIKMDFSELEGDVKYVRHIFNYARFLIYVPWLYLSLFLGNGRGWMVAATCLSIPRLSSKYVSSSFRVVLLLPSNNVRCDEIFANWIPSARNGS